VSKGLAAYYLTVGELQKHTGVRQSEEGRGSVWRHEEEKEDARSGVL
jgi:hypothetical protein